MPPPHLVSHLKRDRSHGTPSWQDQTNRTTLLQAANPQYHHQNSNLVHPGTVPGYFDALNSQDIGFPTNQPLMLSNLVLQTQYLWSLPEQRNLQDVCETDANVHEASG